MQHSDVYDGSAHRPLVEFRNFSFLKTSVQEIQNIRVVRHVFAAKVSGCVSIETFILTSA
ncbi:hypothetical protein GCM10007921_14990 [Tritonibacter mobilis]|nr:hypothetical protein GCM10007921_14990 [Tritonibacter mobilis]